MFKVQVRATVLLVTAPAQVAHAQAMTRNECLHIYSRADCARLEPLYELSSTTSPGGSSGALAFSVPRCLISIVA
jgi:hypothetical protein